jgi:arylsulfatase A-like enzyme
MNRLLHFLVAGALGGALAGALVGIAEATLIVTASGSPEEYWLFPFGLFYYGILGAGIGAALAVLATTFVEDAAGVVGLAAAVAFVPLLFAVGRYHVVQRVFHEELVTQSATGLAVHAGLLAAAIGLSAIAFFALRSVARRQRGFAILVATLLAGLAISAAVATATSTGSAVDIMRSASRQQGVNVVMIIADTLRADAFAQRSGQDVEQSGISRLAADGVVFERAYAQSSWTRPSIATILTSLYPSQHGATHKMDPLPDDVTTIAEAMREEGYWTAGIVTNINIAPIFNFQQGFGEYTYLEPDFYFGATDSATRLAIYKGLRVARERLFGSYMYFNNYYQDAKIVGDTVRAWLETNPPEPFFLLVHYMDPHDPYFEMPYNGRGVARVSRPNPAAEEAGPLHELYRQDVAYLDQHLADLLGQLRSHQVYENSVIALLADHGEEFYEHEGWWHGTTLYEEQVRIPLVIKRARETRSGTVDSRPVRTVDVAPTVMAAAGLPVPAEFVGRDLFSSTSPGDGGMLAEEDLEGNVLSSFMQGEWKIITANPGNPRGLQPIELYHLAEDPAESKNLAAARPEDVTRLLARMEQERRAIDD